ncbi:MAG: glutamine amidotransferase [Armatimonadota bacterium]
MSYCIVLFLLLLAGLACAHAALLNPGFEEMTAESGFHLGESTQSWWLNPAYPPKVTAIADPHLAHTGSVCLRVMPSSTGVHHGDTFVEEGAIGQGDKLAPGEKKRFSVWARGNGLLTLYVYRYAKGLPGPVSEAAGPFTLSNDWERFSFITTGPPECTNAMVAVHVAKDSVAFLDDAAFETVQPPADDLKAEQRDVNGDNKPEVVLENARLRLVLAPWKGGQAISLFDKGRQKELCLDGGVNGGLFIDHDFRQAWPGEAFNAAYQATVSPPDGDSVSATFTYTFTGKWANATEPALTGLVLTKRIILTTNSPAVLVQVRVSNPTGEPKSLRYWAQHIVSASGDPAGDHYLRPGAEGISDVTKAAANPEFIYSPTAGWTAVKNENHALIFTMDYDWLKTLYNCIGASTIEWMLDPAAISPKQTWGTSYRLFLAEIPGKLAYASERLFASVDTAGKLTFTAGYLPLSQAKTKPTQVKAQLFRRFPRFETSIAKLVEVEEEITDGGWPQGSDFPSSTNGSRQLPAIPTADGLYIVRIKAATDAFDYPISHGKAPLAYKMTPPVKQPFTARVQNVTLKKDGSLDVLLVTEASPLVTQRWAIAEVVNALPGKHTLKEAKHTYVHWKGSGEITNFPGTLEELCAFDVVVFATGDASALGPAEQAMLKEYVKMGGGMLVLGGFFSLGKGRCSGTVFESIMPVTVGEPFDLTQVHTPVHPGADSSILTGVAIADTPLVEWMQGISPRPGSTVVLTAKEKPLLVLGTLEKGHTAVFAGTVLGDEGKIAGTPFWTSPAYHALMTNLLRWLAGM